MLIDAAARFFHAPLALEQSRASAIAANATAFQKDPKAFIGSESSDEFSHCVGIVGGVAVIPVRGILLANDPGWIGATGYDWLRMCLIEAFAEPDIRAIALDIDSPGGEVAGCFDLVDEMYDARGTKPIWSILSESAYSAAYALASATDRIIVPRTGGTGSVGVICMHVDFSEALSKAGIEVTLIHFGAKKADGSDVRPLSKSALDRYQADVDTMGELFVETVSRNRKLPTAKVRGTEAGTFLGAAGVEIGFADAVMAPDEAFASLLDELG